MNEKKVHKTKEGFKRKYFIADESSRILSKLNVYDYSGEKFNWMLVADLDTKKESRGKGYATQLLKEAYLDAKKTGNGLYMSVKNDNENAIRLYDKLGYETIKKYKSDDGVSYVIMAKGGNTDQLRKANFS